MKAKFPGRCALTGKSIHIGDEIRFNTARKVVFVSAGFMRNEIVSDPVTFYGENGGNTFYRNRAGRCEDAPCCGCCTI